MMESAEQLTSVPAATIFTGADSVDYVTVVSVGSSEPARHEVTPDNPKSTVDYVTVLKIGNEGCPNAITEETYVYRLPGEKLGFGLKFEGGTKPDEFVKRLFIQSCAVNSPASRVQSSWGSLTEGDEVLEIDSVPVNSMTRIDCVRCLKNSNVVIKLLIRHRFDVNDDVSKIPEDLPLVVSAEKKRTPPPPPPVPPRKVNRKLKDSSIYIPPKGFDDGGSTDPNHLRSVNINNAKNHAYVNTRKYQPCPSPEVSKSVRRRDMINPPDAEVYTDLFTQESTYSLSESDDTGSSISTVVDRLSSFPTTTNSSFAGSLPSTPTPIQRHIDLIDGIDFTSKLTSPAQVKEDDVDVIRENQKSEEIPTTLQPPANFQDAPLSYGNEHVPVVKFAEQKSAPPPPPRNKNQIFINIGGKAQVDDLPRLVDFVPKSSKKAQVKEEETIGEIVSRFLENEKRLGGSYFLAEDNKTEAWNDDDDNSFGWNLPSKLATIGEDAEEEAQCEQKSMAKQKITNAYADVAEETIADDASKGVCNRSQEPAIQVIQPATRSSKNLNKLDRFDVDTMDSPPIYSRQPPDGHEFPDYQEVMASPPPVPEQVPRARHRSISDNLLSKNQPDKNSVRDKIAIFSNASAPTLTKKYTSSENITLSSSPDPFSEGLGKQQKTFSKSALSLDNINGFSSETPAFKLRTPSDEKTQSTTDLTLRPNKKEALPRLHVRSQSLTNMTLPDFTQKQDRWSLMVEQRRKGLSKLKDLVIPEHVSETDTNIRPVLDLPEIKSNVFPSIARAPERKSANSDARQSLPVHVRHSSTSCLSSSPWFSKPADAVPKYSPAFKRKSLTIYGASLPAETKNHEETSKYTKPSYKVSELVNITVPMEAPKSLESITSPTRSDCSFEYVSSPEFRIRNAPEIQQTITYTTKSVGHIEAECAGRSEDDSDSDSALSSSQSSYVSKNSSTDSPVQLQIEYAADPQANDRNFQAKIYQNSCQLEIGNYDSLSRRLLKPQSVEAINRKNILASARCRSGRDLKVGSPLIQRKFEEDGEKTPQKTPDWVPPQEPQEDNSQKNITQAEEEAPEIKAVEVEVPKNIVLENPVVAEIKEKPEIKSERRKSFERPPPIATTPNKKVPKSFGIVAPATSVTDLRKNFEKAGPPPVLRNMSTPAITLPIITTPTEEIVPIKRTSLPFLVKTDPMKPEVVSDQANEKITCDTLKEFDDSVSREDLKVIVLKPEILGRSLGITLAGGADYETKEITVHKIRNGSLAFTDGRLRKGDRILAINGKYMKGVSHGESIAALKEIVPEITIVACTVREAANVTSPKTQAAFKFSPPPTPEKGSEEVGQSKREMFEVSIEKDAAGLGFSIQGGNGSVQGDVPLTIKKLFMGGSAERSGKLKVDDELVEINGVNVSSMSRIDAWNLMKKLPEGEVVLVIRR